MATARLTALDVFRGLAVAAMVFVNNPGDPSSTHPQLLHAPWHGWTFTDLVFPAFLVAVGSALAFDLGGGRSGWRVYARIARRLVLLIALGLFLNALPFDGGPLRYPGVLQRIAVAYTIGALVTLHLGVRAQVALAALLLGGGWAVLELVDVPGHGAGVLTMEGNAFGWIDRSVFGQEHMHLGRPTDPEGLAGTVVAVVHVLGGAWAGRWLRSERKRTGTTLALGAAAAIATAAGLAWSVVLPINKRIGTPSFVVFTTGVALLVLAALYELVDVRAWRALGRPFEILGRNAIVAYVGTEIVHKTVHPPVLVGAWPSAAWAGAFVAGAWVVLYVLWRLRVFVRV